MNEERTGKWLLLVLVSSRMSLVIASIKHEVDVFYFSSVFSVSFHYSTDFSSIISISFHYSTYFSSIFSKSIHYSTYFSSIISQKKSHLNSEKKGKKVWENQMFYNVMY
jgi:hypothetical protein